jgi:hypothetical protein
MACSRYYPGIVLEGLRKPTKTFTQDTWYQAEIQTKNLHNASLERYPSGLGPVMSSSGHVNESLGSINRIFRPNE